MSVERRFFVLGYRLRQLHTSKPSNVYTAGSSQIAWPVILAVLTCAAALGIATLWNL